MAYQYADYTGRAQSLVSAGEELLESIDDADSDPSIAIQDIEAAARTRPDSEVLGFAQEEGGGMGPPLPPPADAQDAISSLLLEIQGANMLMSAGIALNEHGGGANRSLLSRSIQEADSSRSAVAVDQAARAELLFAPAVGVKSSTLAEAKKAFLDNSQGVLNDIVDDTVSVVNSILEQLTKLDGAKILDGIDKLGESFQTIAAAGRLIRLGLDKLKSALDALTKLFGKEKLGEMTAKIKEIWTKFKSGEYTREAMVWMLGVQASQGRITAALAPENLDLAKIDGASNDLPPLSVKHKSIVKLLRALTSGVVLAAGIIGVLQLAAPWVPLALVGVYAALIAAAVLVGMDYCDSGSVLNWVRGVGQIANEIKP